MNSITCCKDCARRELGNFLSEVVRDNTGEYPFAKDVLDLMRSIERKLGN